MKIRKIVSIAIVSGSLLLVSFTASKFFFDRNQLILDIVMSGLNNAHYSPQKLDDEFSAKFMELYIKRMDYGKKFLNQEDIARLNQYRTRVDDEIANSTFELYELSAKIAEEAVLEKENWYKEILSKPFEYSKEEIFETDGEKQSFVSNDAALKEEWRKYLKYQVVARLSDLLDEQDKIKNAKDTTAKITPFDTLELQARKRVLKLNDDWFKRLKKVSRKERFSVYINTITAMYDPHTEFFPPVEKKKFDQSMSGQLEGIGARLTTKDEYIKVSEIVVGSPSWKEGNLKAGDLILKVAQGDKEAIDVVGMDIDDAIELIKGKKGTEVKLTVKKADGNVKVISIVRDIIQLEETFAHSAILNNKKKIGYIKLPSFYSDFTRNGAHRCAQDVKKEIEKLKGEGVEGLVLDLRDNGGGSLQEVVDMAGLFIPKGPIVQVRKKNGSSDQLRDYNGEQQYGGPVVIMVNHNSASASEILAAALQDYKRAVILGTPSFGKGTVQSFIDLDNYLLPQFDSVRPLGSVKVTMQKFYRISGGTTQLKGVIPDIALPDPYSLIEVGEKELDNPLPWDEMPKADYTPYSNIDYEKLKKLSTERVKKNKSFQLMEQESKDFKMRRDDSQYSLNLEKYRAEVKKLRDDAKKFDELKNDVKGFDTQLLAVDISNMQNDSLKTDREKKWANNLKKDIYLFEATNVINDLK